MSLTLRPLAIAERFSTRLQAFLVIVSQQSNYQATGTETMAGAMHNGGIHPRETCQRLVPIRPPASTISNEIRATGTAVTQNHGAVHEGRTEEATTIA